MARKRNRYQDEAEAASIVRYGPELSVLTALLKQAEEDRDLRLRQAKSGRQRGVGAVDAAVPQIQSAYQGAANAVTPAFANQGGVEAGALGARLGEAKALAESQLAARRVSAIEGEGAARAGAYRDFRSDRGKITDRFRALEQERGAFTSQAIGDLNAAADKALADAASQQASLTQSERNSIRSSGFDPDQPLDGGGYAPLPGGKADPTKKPKKAWVTPIEQGKAGDTVQLALTWAKDLQGSGYSRKDVADTLLAGAPRLVEKVYDPVTNKPVLWKAGDKDEDGEPISPSRVGTQKTRRREGVPKIESQLYLSAALDMAFDGHLSRRNQRLLHERGIKLSPLGVTTYQQWKAGRGRITRPANAPGSATGRGQSRPT